MDNDSKAVVQAELSQLQCIVQEVALLGRRWASRFKGLGRLRQ
jgi:hypothetical protein